MFRSFEYLRGCVYPRGGLTNPASSDALLGIVMVMLAVVGIAYVVDATLF